MKKVSTNRLKVYKIFGESMQLGAWRFFGTSFGGNDRLKPLSKMTLVVGCLLISNIAKSQETSLGRMGAQKQPLKAQYDTIENESDVALLAQHAERKG